MYSYIFLYPLLLLLTKSAALSVQSVMHVLFVPTVGKVRVGRCCALYLVLSFFHFCFSLLLCDDDPRPLFTTFSLDERS
jgi:hypothetical protein